MTKKYIAAINESYFGKFFLFALLAIGYCKLVLVGTNEIISIPNDSVNYLRQSREAIGELGAPSGYPFWLAITASIGLPQRLAIEILYLFSSASLAFVLVGLFGRLFALLLFLVLAFLPATFFLFDNALSDGFFACLTLLALALTIRLMLDHDCQKVSFWIRLLLLALVLGWMLITRNEDYLVIGWILWFIACRNIFQRQFRSQKEMMSEVALCCALLLLGAFSMGSFLSAYHWATNGVYARTLATMPSHMQLLHNLASIDSGTTINRVPITRAQREVAYQASPTLGRLQEQIENPENMYQIASLSAGFPSGEIGAGWVWHIFNDAAIKNLSEKSLKNLNDFYVIANSELNRAYEQGDISRKFAIHPFIAGNTTGIMSQFPGSVVRVFEGMFESIHYQPDNGFESSLFNSTCLRRESLIDLHIYSGQVQGWAFVDYAGASVAKAEVGVYEASRGVAGAQWYPTEQIERPDVIKGLTEEGRTQPKVFGYRTVLPRVQGDGIAMRYYLSDGEQLVSPPLVPNKVTRIQTDSDEGVLVQGIDTAGTETETLRNGARHKLQEWLIASYENSLPYILTIVLTLATITVILHKKIIRSIREKRLYGPVLILIAGLFMQRIAFYAFVDAVGWDVEVRYLVSALVLLLVAFAVLIAFISRNISDNLDFLFHRVKFSKTYKDQARIAEIRN